MWWPFKKKKDGLKNHSGKCDVCSDYGVIWLDGVSVLCWPHYCEEMQRQAEYPMKAENAHTIDHPSDGEPS